jgi:hypothetical protein
LSEDRRQFIYEMVQNIDDTPHTRHPCEITIALIMNPSADAAASNDDSLSSAAAVLLVLSRQDGFTERDLEGICSLSSGRSLGQVSPISDEGQSAAVSSSNAEETLTTGEKGVGFKSVFTVSSEPMIISTHVDSKKKNSSLKFSIPTKKSVHVIKDENGNDKLVESIPYITPVPLEDSKVQWIGTLADAVHRQNPTGVSLASGTILALPIADLESAAKISRILKGNDNYEDDLNDAEKLSPLDFFFLNRIKKVSLLVLEGCMADQQCCGRVLRYYVLYLDNL